MKHEHYELLNLLGYGLAKFDTEFIVQFGFNNKTSFYNYFVEKGIVSTASTVKNRQDLFDPFFDNKRKGWWQKGDTYLHRKIFIDSLFGSLDVIDYSNTVKLYLQEKLNFDNEVINASPIIKSQFKQLQKTGLEAELFFLHHYQEINTFKNGVLEDARLFGDGYDFQIKTQKAFFLLEIKGVREPRGSIRMTQNEFYKAQEYCENYGLVIISNLNDIPKMKIIFNPTIHISFTRKEIKSTSVNYYSESVIWKNLT